MVYSTTRNYKENNKTTNMFDLFLGPFKIGLILSVWLYIKQQKVLSQNVFQIFLNSKIFLE